ncbi:hypothetical protein PG994_012518 [Apiospora phragmitis]|uniref:Uncharacterized protein n=1 Tax=Apiospora phragmitis TaxID=2905665 RepID=A0ABR1TVX9_9PEZI
MRAYTLFAATFFALAQAAPDPRKATAVFYREAGSCADAGRGAEVNLFESGNATVAADSAYYSFLVGKIDPACTVEYDVDFSRIKWNNQNNNKERRAALDADTIDMKGRPRCHVGEEVEVPVAPVHPRARREVRVITVMCESIAWKDEGVLAINAIKVTGC